MRSTSTESPAVDKRLWVNPNTGEQFEVDINLTDDWLLRLNSLSALKMTSNCEGHIGATNFYQKNHPILRFHLRERFADRAKMISCQQQERIDSVIHSAIDSPATEVRHGWDQLRENIYFIDVDSRLKRTSIEMESCIEKWFDETVTAFEQIDRGLAKELT